MRSDPSGSPPTLALLVALVTLVAGIPVAVHHHADHDDDRVHIERSHGGHGGLLEQDDARVPAPHAPAVLSTRSLHLPGLEPVFTSAPILEDFLTPRGRAPPPDLPRGPPTSS